MFGPRARQELFDLVEYRVLIPDERQVVATRQFTEETTDFMTFLLW